jgi:hypothetical protein
MAKTGKRRKIEPGNRYGRLVVVEYDKVDLYGNRRLRFYTCECDCGNIGSYPGTHLGKNIKSCGCMQKDIRKIEILPGTRFGRLVVLKKVSDEIVKDRGHVYLCECDCGNEKEIYRNNLRSGNIQSCGCLHKELFNSHKEFNYKKLFVEGTNLPVIKSDKAQINNKLGVKGVSLRKNGRYEARITFQYKSYYLGTFDSLEDAIKARKEAEERLFKPVIEKYEGENENETKEVGE